MGKFFGHDTPFEVYITPLDNRETSGAWASFPTTPDTLRDIFQTMGIGPSGWAISNVECHIYGVADVLRGCDNLDELNYLASKLTELSAEDVDRFAVVVEIDEHCDSMEELINLCDNLECYDFNDEVTDYDELGRHTLRESTYLDRRTLDELDDYIDYEAYGKEVQKSEGGIFADNCYVVPTGASFMHYYRGEIGDIPEEYLVTTKIEVPELTEDERLDKSIELAMDLDHFFRTFDKDYAARYPNVQQQQETLCDSLFAGKIAAIDAMLEDLGQGEHDVLPLELAEFKAAIRYDPSQDPLPEKMKVLVVEPRKVPYVKDILPGEESLSGEVRGPITAKYPFDDMVALVYNDDARNMGMELNRALYNSQGQPCDVIPGTFLVVGLGESTFTSLPEDMIGKYTEQFQTVEVFAQVGNRTVVFKVPPDRLSDLDSKTLDSIIRSGVDVKKPSIRDRLEAARKEIAGRQIQPHTRGRNEPEL